MRVTSFLAGLAATLAVACFSDSGVSTLGATPGSTSAGESADASTGTSTAPTSTDAGTTSDPDSTSGTSGASGGCSMEPCCGDGVVTMGEQCDDGNDVEDDFCTGSCERRALRVFVTSTKWRSGGGLDSADAFCNTTALSAKLPGTYRAWLSTSTTSAIDHVAPNAVLPILRLDATTVSESPGDLGAGSLLAPISIDENGDALADPPGCTENAVWTGTAGNGESSGNHCADWTLVMGGAGTLGHQTATDSKWTDATCQIDCIAGLHLYCFEVG
jgi:cysteine-rich repeat protein